MDIYVNISRIHLKINQIRRLFTFRHKAFEGGKNSLMEIRMAHKTPIDKEILLRNLLAG